MQVFLHQLTCANFSEQAVFVQTAFGVGCKLGRKLDYTCKSKVTKHVNLEQARHIRKLDQPTYVY